MSLTCGVLGVWRQLFRRILTGVTFNFPDDLLWLERDLLRALDRWSDAAQRGDQSAIDEAYRAAQTSAVYLHRHSWLRECETPYQARMALREAARQSLTADGEAGS